MRAQTFSRWLFGGAAALLIAAAASPASAQDGGLALNRFNPAPAGDRFFGVPSAAVPGQNLLHAMLLVDYAHNPLIIRQTSDDAVLRNLVTNQLFLHMNATLAATEQFEVNLDLPIALWQSGDTPDAANIAGDFKSAEGAAIGDIRAAIRLNAIGDYFSAFQLGFGGYVWLPTASGDAGTYVGDGTARGLPFAVVGGRMSKWVYSAMLGIELRGDTNFANVSQGTMFHFGAAAGILLGDARRLQIGPEFTFASVLQDVGKRNVNSELILGARYRFSNNFEAGVGAGPGLSSGIGTPDLRVVGMLAYSPEQVKKAPPPPDTDKDGIVDPQDACVNEPGPANADPKKNGCPPPPDRDNDGIIDAQDACPDQAGPANADPAKNGCPPPPDTDNDGIVDPLDACPAVPGVANEDPKKNGCPPDKDNDGIIDAEDACVDYPGFKSDDKEQNGCPLDTDCDTLRDDKDACPKERGVIEADPKKTGCPVSVRVTDTEVVILQQVQFDTAKATIRKVSDPLLDEVAGVFKEHPELTKIEVQGHTDNKGTPALNEKLSQARAESVMKALVKRGIDAARLSAKGYGQNKPVATNDTDEGRQQNRRVQFVILEKQKVDPAAKAQDPAKAQGTSQGPCKMGDPNAKPMELPAAPGAKKVDPKTAAKLTEPPKTGGTAEKPAAKPAEKPAAKPAEKPAAKPAEKPAAKPAEKPAAKPAAPAPKPAAPAPKPAAPAPKPAAPKK